MSDLTLLVMRIGFLLLLWFFIFAIVYALKSDLFGAPVRKMSPEAQTSRPTGGPAPTPVVSPVVAVSAPLQSAAHGQFTPPPDTPAHPQARVLTITSGVAAGTTIPLEDDSISIGRSSDSTLVIVDEYTSTYHARLNRSGDDWILTDLDSTNGTKLDGVRVTTPTRIPLFTPITIGNTTFELRS